MSKTIKLTKGYETIVSDEDYSPLSKWKWHALVTKWGVYAVRDYRKKGEKRITYLMHRVVTECPEGMVIDHINHNALDNTRGNLRICTQAQNMANSRGQKNKTSPYKGVFFSKGHNKFRAVISVNKKRKSLGLFSCDKQASEVYNKIAAEMHGEFALSQEAGGIAS